jgi:hypothetical protein
MNIRRVEYNYEYGNPKYTIKNEFELNVKIITEDQLIYPEPVSGNKNEGKVQELILSDTHSSDVDPSEQ